MGNHCQTPLRMSKFSLLKNIIWPIHRKSFTSCQMSRHPLLAEESTEPHLSEVWRVQQGSASTAVPWGAGGRPWSCVGEEQLRCSCTWGHPQGSAPTASPETSDCLIPPHMTSGNEELWNPVLSPARLEFAMQTSSSGGTAFFAAFGKAQLSHLWLFCFIVLCISPQIFSMGLCWQKQKCIDFTDVSQGKMCPEHHHF